MHVFSDGIILLNQKFSDEQVALTYLSEVLVAKKIVSPDFPKQILKREETYPTGLMLSRLGVAIPHTDAQYVNQDQIGVMTLSEPVTFKSMADPNETVPVQMIFMLALHKSDEQPRLLQQLMTLFQEEEWMDQLYQATSTEEVLHLLDQTGLIDI
ncbi:MAG: PTS sugar transporter subunit IIA [Aerococcus sp.]|nr:PTS sugar transporter subunit IIA [Aerococcus sp.]